MKFDKKSLTLKFDDIEEIRDLIEDEWDINDGRGMSGIRKKLVDLLERDLVR